MVAININFSNKFVYLVVGILALVLVAGVAIAFGAIPNPGHAAGDLQTCDSAGQTLVMNAAGDGWECGSGVGGSLSCTYEEIPDSTTTGNEVCNAVGETCLVVTEDLAHNAGSAFSCEHNTNANYRAKCCKIA